VILKQILGGKFADLWAFAASAPRRLAISTAIVALIFTGNAAESANAEPEGFPTVAVVPGSTINLVSRESKIPVSVRNDFDAEVKVHVYLQPDSFRVIVPQGVEVIIPPLTTVNAQIPVRAIGNGDVTLAATVTTFSGHQLGDPVELKMTVNADVEGYILIFFTITVAGLAVLGAIRTIRRRLNPLSPPPTNEDKYETSAITVISEAEAAAHAAQKAEKQ
jgi:hypothetical protein